MPPRCLLGQAFVQPNLKKEAEELKIWISLLSPPPCEPDPLVMFSEGVAGNGCLLCPVHFQLKLMLHKCLLN